MFAIALLTNFKTPRRLIDVAPHRDKGYFYKDIGVFDLPKNLNRFLVYKMGFQSLYCFGKLIAFPRPTALFLACFGKGSVQTLKLDSQPHKSSSIEIFKKVTQLVLQVENINRFEAGGFAQLYGFVDRPI